MMMTMMNRVLGNNQLSGTIPSSIGSLENLGYLYDTTSNNQIHAHSRWWL